MSPTPPSPDVAVEPFGGRYQVLRPLGIGRMTMVFEAWDQDEGRRVALKLPVQQFADDEAFLARLRREVEAVVDLDHPNVAAVHGIELEGPGTFVVVELVEGSTLWDMLAARGPLPSVGAARVAAQACAALDTAHARGLTHGHLTPANVLLRIDGRVKLTDFRLAQAARPLAAAPDPEGDLRALGRCMVVMLTGEEPIPDKRIRLRPEVHDELAAIVVKAAGEHQQGYRSAADLGRDLARFLDMSRSAAPLSLPGVAQRSEPPSPVAVDAQQSVEPLRSHPATAPEPRRAASAPTRRHLWLGVIGLAGACLAVVVALIAFAGLGRDPDGQAAHRTMAGAALALMTPSTSLPPFGGGEPAATTPPATAPQTTAAPETTTAPQTPTTTVGGGAGGSGQRVVVPNVVGQRREQALAALAEARLAVQVVLVEVRGAGRVDRVVSQNPSAGQAVPPGSTVTLTVGAKRPPG